MESSIMVKWTWLSVTALLVVGLVCGAITMFGWMIDETHFDRPDENFDRLAGQIESLPGVSVDDTQRWVEAPTFSSPQSYISVSLDEASLPGLLAAGCETDYRDPVYWSLRIRTDGGNVLSAGSGSSASDNTDASRCLDFGFDAAGLLGEVDSVGRGLALQAAISEDDHFAIVALDERSGDLAALLPVVAHADDLREAAGLDSSQSVEINAGNLIAVIEPDEQERYVAVLSDLVEKYGVTSYWADGAGSQIDGVEKVQVVAPDDEHSAIEARIRASGLHIADLPVRFLPLD